MRKKLLFLVVLAMVLSLALASCADRVVTELEIIDGTFKYEYELGETVDLSGLKVKASYSDGSYRELTADQLTLGTIDTSTTGTKQLTIAFDDFSISVDVSVVKELDDDTPVVTLSSVSIDATSVLTKVKVGDSYSTAEIKATATYSDGTTKPLTAQDLTVNTIDTATKGEKKLTATYQGVTGELTVTVIGVKSMQIFGAPTAVAQDGTLDTDGIIAVVTYTDDTVATVTADDLTFGAFDTATAGAKSLEISYLDGNTAVTITVTANAVLVGIEVNTSNIAQYITGVPDGTDLNLAAIKAGAIVYLYYGHSANDIVRNETLSDNDLLTVTESENGGKRYVKIAYQGFEKQIEVLEGDPIVESIEIVAGSFTDYVMLGGSFDAAGLSIKANLSNGSAVQYPLGTTGLTISAIDTAEAGTKTLTATYDGKTATAEVYVLPVSQIVLNSTPDLRVAKGGTLNYSGLEFTVIYSDGTHTVSETVAISAMTVGTIDVASKGEKSFTVTYKGANGSVPYLVKEASSIALKQPEDGKLEGITKLQIGATLDTSVLSFILTWSDGSTEIVTVADGVVLGALDTSTAGTKSVSITYLDATGSFSVNVNEYIIMGVSKPSSLTALENKADGSPSSKIAYFLDSTNVRYVVGDDNNFYFTLRLLVLDEDDKEITITNYTSKSLIYIIEDGNQRLLEGDEYDKYIDAVDETKNAFDFSEEAVGKQFMIATRPASGIFEDEAALFTRTHTFTVVNAWNIYTPKELHVLTNFNDRGSASGEKTQMEIAHSFLDQHNIERPSGSIAGVVLHNDLDIKISDIPTDYLIYTGTNYANGEKVYNIYDAFSIFAHHNDYYNAETGKYEFTFYGNYYTIYSYSVPLTNNDTTLGNTVFGADSGADGISSAQLFLFDNANANTIGSETGEYYNENYVLNIENLYLMDDNPNNPTGTAEESARAMRGVIGMKVRHQDVTVTNTIMERYFISFFGDRDYLDITLDRVKFYNAWQNHIYLWGHNQIQNSIDSTIAPSASGAVKGHHNIQIDVMNSEITVCGGPIIISQTMVTDSNSNVIGCNVNSGADVRISDDTEIYTFVQASAAWFQAFNATQEAALIESINALFKQGYGHSYLVGNPLDGYTGDFMNMIMLNMTDGHAAFGSGFDIDGTLTIADTQILNMKDSDFETAVGALMAQGYTQDQATMAVLGGQSTANYNGNLALDALIAGGAKEAPIFQSTAGTAGTSTVNSTVYYNGEKLVGLQGDADASHGLFTSGDDYLTLYYGGMGIVFGDFHACTGTGDGYCKASTAQ